MRIFEWTKRKSRGEIILYSMVSLLFFIIAASYVYILVWAFISGAKTHTEIVMDPFGLPKEWHFEHYLEVFSKLEVNGNNFWNMLFNSIWFSVVNVLIHQFFSIMLAYACSKYRFPGSTWIYTLVLIVMTLPLYGNGGGMYKLYYDLGLLNNYAEVISATNVFTTFFMYYYAFWKNVSWAYAEAAMMDGANAFQIYFKVMFPQAKAIFGALFLTNWLSKWNSYESALIYMPKLPTLPVGIYQFNLEMLRRARLDILFAACIIITIPALVLFVVFNKTITTNVSIGGIKG